MTFPPEPTTTIDWTDIGFKVREVNGHVETKFTKTSGQWTEPKFVEDPFIRLHGLAPGLNYGQHCYEGLKAFRQKDGQIRIFRPDQNARRMQHSASFIAIPEPPVDLFLKAVHLAVSKNAEFVPPHETGASMYIRPLLFGSSCQLGLSPTEEYTLLVYVLPVGVYHGIKPVDCLVLENFDRAAPQGVGSAKVGGNYAPVLIHSEAAYKKGYGITLHLDSGTRTYIDEFSTSGFLALRNPTAPGEKHTLIIPDSNSVIKSVTSDSAAQIAAKRLGWNVEVRKVHYNEIPTFTEVFAAGTAAGLLPIKSIELKSQNMKKVFCEGDEPGPGYKQLSDILKGIQRGLVADKDGWCSTVQAPAH
ncbi:branched-chain amino acid aminotransferase II [Terfezia boudieri ATCC MYA-4762]|uniref:Branched-chain amino acid aminotransferase II n=1 Tax=Terfezia boudieri ATCC MYA-4762 TaxID=1051890 RepID=A0A3N4LY63_9PEZI|nr:branched-chain amino acid aminotransferase II [Terfezia boudieri ATCC MYA-4762]